MSTNPETNSPSSKPTARPSKKILLFTADDKIKSLLLREIEAVGHLVMATVTDPDQLEQEIARTTPHQLIVHGPAGSEISDLVQTVIRKAFPDLPIGLLDGTIVEGSTSWRQKLKALLTEPIAAQIPRPYADDQRVVFHDASLQAMWQGKLNRPEQKPGWEQICSNQEARFIIHLQAGRKNHQAAKHYLACLPLALFSNSERRNVNRTSAKGRKIRPSTGWEYWADVSPEFARKHRWGLCQYLLQVAKKAMPMFCSRQPYLEPSETRPPPRSVRARLPNALPESSPVRPLPHPSVSLEAEAF
jgi:hypothetical protein